MEDMEACTSNDRAHKKGISNKKVVEYYDDWAKRGHYEIDLGPSRYRGPEYAAQALADYVPLEMRTSFRVLDLGAGTGFVGLQLSQRGFSQIDALEPSKEMLQQAEMKKVYKQLLCYGVGVDPTPLPDDSYDALVLSGALGEGHVPCVALFEFARIVKPGGFVVIMMRKQYLEEVDEYKGRLEPLMQKMEEIGAWVSLQRETKPKYSFNNDGVLFVFRVLVLGFDKALLQANGI